MCNVLLLLLLTFFPWPNFLALALLNEQSKWGARAGGGVVG